jgi:hypothetical protein
MKLKYNGSISNGKMTIFNRQDLLDTCNRIGELDILITIEERKRKRTNNQNSYYWAVLVPCVRQGLLDLGHELTLEEVHEFLKVKFNSKSIIDESTGEVLAVIGGSTTNLDTFDFGQYFEAIIRWAAEYLGVEIPYPNEQMSIGF